MTIHYLPSLVHDAMKKFQDKCATEEWQRIEEFRIAAVNLHVMKDSDGNLMGVSSIQRCSDYLHDLCYTLESTHAKGDVIELVCTDWQAERHSFFLTPVEVL